MNIHAMATEGQGLLMSDSTFTATTSPYTASNNYKYNSTNSISQIKRETRCRPSKGRRCIPDVVLKNEGSIMQICRNINVHVVNTDTC